VVVLVEVLVVLVALLAEGTEAVCYPFHRSRYISNTNSIFIGYSNGGGASGGGGGGYSSGGYGGGGGGGGYGNPSGGNSWW
jgi:uncharacterized membrane protein